MFRKRKPDPRLNSRLRYRKAFLEPLEDRRLLAADFSIVDRTLHLEINSEDQQVEIKSLGDRYEFGIQYGDWVGNVPGFILGGGDKLVIPDGTPWALFDQIVIDDNAANTSVEFVDSGISPFNHHITVELDRLDAGNISFSGQTTFTGAANLTAMTTREIRAFGETTHITTHDGNLVLKANTQTPRRADINQGVVVSNAKLEVAGTGNISIEGRAGGDETNPQCCHVVGVSLRGGAVLRGGGTGSIFTVEGHGGEAVGDYNYGVWIGEGTTIDTIGGDVNFIGYGGNSTIGTNNSGIVIQDSMLGATAAGNIALKGVGGSSDGSFNHGVFLGSETQINSEAGTISIAGDGGGNAVATSDDNRGVYVQSGAKVLSNSNIVIAGVGGVGGGNHNEGIRVAAYGEADAITQISTDGSIELNGTGGGTGPSDNNYGVNILSRSVIESATRLSLVGTGGGGSTGSHNYGIRLADAETTVRTVGSAALDIQGIGGSTSGTGNVGVFIVAGSSVVLQNGDGRIDGRAGDGNASQGIVVSQGAQVDNLGSGKLTISGVGSALRGTEQSHGVFVHSAGVISSVGTGAILVEGQGGVLGDVGNRGVYISNENTRIQSALGSLEVAGIGGGGDGSHGVVVDGAAKIIGSDGPEIIVSGLGGDGVGGHSNGVALYSRGEILSQGTSDIRVEGVGGRSSSGGQGVHLQDDARISSTSSGTITIDGKGTSSDHGYAYGVTVTTLSSVSSNDGDILVNGEGGDGAGNYNHGVIFWDQSTLSTGDGNIVVTGQGGGSSSAIHNTGINFGKNSVASATGVGHITLIGNGGRSKGHSNNGIIVFDNSMVKTIAGDVEMVGRGGGAHESSDNMGILINASSTITAFNNGAIDLLGYGGSSEGALNHGIQVHGSGSSVTAVDGEITISGTGGGSASSENNGGVHIEDGALVNTLGAGNISILGDGGKTTGPHNRGLFIKDAIISSSGGAISGLGRGGGLASSSSSENLGIQIHDSNVSTLLSGEMSLIGYGGNGNGKQFGIEFTGTSGTTAVETVDGDMNISGYGGHDELGSAGEHYGVVFNNGGDVRSTGTGNVTVHGRAGSSQGGGNHGVAVYHSSTVGSTDGTLLVTGIGGGGPNSTNNEGIIITAGGAVRTTGSGDLNLSGTGGRFGGSNHGLQTDNSSQISVAAGSLSINGQGGGAVETDENIGINLRSQITLGTGSAMYLNGKGGGENGNTNTGVVISTDIQQVGGDLTIRGIGGTTDPRTVNNGILIAADSTISSVDSGGDVSLQFSSLWVSPDATIETGVSDSVSLEVAKGNGRPGDLVLSNVERTREWPTSGSAALWETVLDRFQTKNLLIGGKNTRNIFVDGEVTRDESTNITFSALNSLEITEFGSVNLAQGDVHLVNQCTVDLSKYCLQPNSHVVLRPYQQAAEIQSGAFNLSDTASLSVTIEGPVANRLYDQLRVSGEVGLSGGLILEGEYIPAIGDSFLVVDNDGTDLIEGHFDGLPEGALIDFNGSPLSITYQGGTGNDVELTAVSPLTEKDVAYKVEIINPINDVPYSGMAEITEGSEFEVRVSVRDSRVGVAEEEAGVYAAYLDLVYDSEYLEIVPATLRHGQIFTDIQHSDASVAGLLDEVGGVQGGISNFVRGSQFMELFTVDFIATKSTVGRGITLELNQADVHPLHDTVVISPPTAISGDHSFFGVANLTIQAPAFEWHNYLQPADVNQDGYISAVDALHIVNHLNTFGAHQLPATKHSGMPWIDVDQDQWVSPADAISVINHLNASPYDVFIGAQPVDLEGNPISAVAVGEQFYLSLITEDLRQNSEGVFAAYADVEYSSTNFVIDGDAVFPGPYSNGRSANTESDGLIDEWGAFAGLNPTDGSRYTVSRIPMKATEKGSLSFTPTPADLRPTHDVLLFGTVETVEPEAIRFESWELVVLDEAEGEYEGTSEDVIEQIASHEEADLLTLDHFFGEF